jgi:hypothetical protein
MSKKFATVAIGGTRKKVRPCTRWRYEAEDGFNAMGIIKKQVVVRGLRKWRKTLLETMVQC